ncbi:SPOR domain-containing protein [Candidatus Methylobacter oryzae]|uniref:SPOR domain-containing protein n=1 Tax=Candidatus Methylobacter oryzae TaxID=2497749 RepID=A0ABY3CA54_9GAMM|nr:SPOR domain-containing protein [Candidatus Methylobacter oryzae]TRW94746.1 hypothetical protein EKO24_011045 [Candidatus Methylobacter oryzae]
MTDPIDKKSKEKRDNLDVDLDAMLDEAESSLLPRDEFKDDDDTIDRLLMDAGFDTDDEIMPSKARADVGLHDELDDFLDFDDFGEDFNAQEKPSAAVAELAEPVGSSPDFPLTDSQDEEDAIDRLLMNAQLDADNSDELDELNDFSDFSDFAEPDPMPADETNEPELAADSLSTFTDDAVLTDEIDAVDKSGRGDEDEVEVPAPAMAAVREPTLEAGSVDIDEELDSFSDFSDFVEPDPIPVIDEPEQVAENLSAHDEEELQDEIDDFFSLDGFDESDLIQDDQVKSSIAAEVESEPGQPAAFEPPSNNAGLSDEIDDFLNFDGLDQPDPVQDVLVKSSVPTDTEINPQQSAEFERSIDTNAGLPDEIDDFFSQGGFDESDMILDDVESSIPAKVEADQEQQVESSVNENAAFADELDDFFSPGSFDESDMIQDDDVPVKAEPQAVVEPSFGAEPADEMDDFFNLGGFDESDMIEDDVESPAPAKVEADQEQQAESLGDENAAFADEFDDFFSPGSFDESDMIQDDGVESSNSLPEVAPNQEQQVSVGESSGLQNDENSFDSLFMDSDFNEEDALEQAVDKKDEFGDDTDLSEIDEFFQLDEVSDDFSKETGEADLTGGERSTQDEDDFLLPDFDITADMETSDMGSNPGTKTDDLADAFGDSDFLDEDDVIQAFKPEIPELKPGDDDSVFEAQPKQAADTVSENPENAKNSASASGQGDVKKQLEDAERRVKKAKLFAYIALGFGTVALSAAAGLGVMTYNAKSEVSKLTETVTSLEASLAKNAENNPKEEINAVMDSVVQLNQKVYGFITELKGSPQSLADLLNNKVPDIAAKQDMVSKALDMLQTKVGGEGRMPLLESLVAAPIKTEAVHEPAAPAKIEPAQEHAPSKASEAHPSKEKNAHEVAPTKERAKHEEASAKAEPVPEAAPAKAKTQEEAEPVIPPKAILKKEEPAKINEPTTVGKWGVNLAAFKQEWFAKSKAAEFARQGIFAEVIPVYERNATMYRLRVGGFRTKAEANANTARIKQTLNLDSVWVSDN